MQEQAIREDPSQFGTGAHSEHGKISSSERAHFMPEGYRQIGLRGYK